MDEIQVRADAVRAVLADRGHACIDHPVSPETMDRLLKNHAVDDVDRTMRLYPGTTAHDPFAGIA